MNFSEKLDRDLLRVDFRSKGKEDALHKIAALASASPLLEGIGEDELYKRLAEREAAVTTGLGNGVAIPHARIPGLSDFVIFALVSHHGIDFQALDKRKVHIFFVVFAPPDRVTEHLKVLATISRMLSQSAIKREILQSADVDTLYEIIARTVDEGGGDVSAKDQTRKLLFLILYYEDDLQAVLEYLIDQGVEGATVIESKGMGAYISTMPLFAGFLNFMREDRNASSTIMALIPARHEQVILHGIEKITGDLDKKQGAMMITLDVSFFKGTMDMI